MFHCSFVINKVLPIYFSMALPILYCELYACERAETPGHGEKICLYCLTLLLLYTSMPLQLYDSGIVLWTICLYCFLLLLLYASTPLHLYTSTTVHLYASTPLRLYTSTPLRLYTSTPLRLYTSTPLHLYVSTPVRLYALGLISQWICSVYRCRDVEA